MIEEPFAHGNSILHRLDPRVKIVTAVVYSVVVAVVYQFPALAAAFVISTLLLRMAGLNLKTVVKRLALVNGFVLMFWLILPLTANGQILYQWGPMAIYQPGVIIAAQITLKSNAILMALIALVATMRFATLGHALNRLRLPEKFVFLFMLTYRYIFVIEAEYKRIWRAVKIRGFYPKTSIHCYKTYAYMIGMLFIRAANRAERVYRAMRCRGFTGRFYSLAEFRPSAGSWIFSTFMAFISAGLIFLEWFSHGL
ncbi:MAG: cobalt ECF transporter T component CbiQ [Thermodesulfobacteriota bacterium]